MRCTNPRTHSLTDLPSVHQLLVCHCFLFFSPKLQRAQNTLERIILPNLRSTPVASLLLHLYWLPVISRIRYKLATITYKSLSVAQPTYLHLLLQQYQPTPFLQSSSQNLLALPTLSSEFGTHAFSYCTPSV